MNEKMVLYKKTEESIGLLTLNRPQNANTLHSGLVNQALEKVSEIEKDEQLRVLVITGAGKYFCAGADLKEKDRPGGVDVWLNNLRQLFNRIEALSIPTIAAINGSAMGGGCELALVCDLRVMAETAQIGVPEIKIGALAFAGGTQRLSRQVGVTLAKEMHFIGEPISAAEAFRIGLVNRVVPAEKVMEESLSLAASLASRSKRALGLAKFLIDSGRRMNLKEGLEIEALTSRFLTDSGYLEAEIRRAAERNSKYRDIFKESE